jgi:hypothetical protein
VLDDAPIKAEIAGMLEESNIIKGSIMTRPSEIPVSPKCWKRAERHQTRYDTLVRANFANLFNETRGLRNSPSRSPTRTIHSFLKAAQNPNPRTNDGHVIYRSKHPLSRRGANETCDEFAMGTSQCE